MPNQYFYYLSGDPIDYRERADLAARYLRQIADSLDKHAEDSLWPMPGFVADLLSDAVDELIGLRRIDLNSFLRMIQSSARAHALTLEGHPERNLPLERVLDPKDPAPTEQVVTETDPEASASH